MAGPLIFSDVADEAGIGVSRWLVDDGALIRIKAGALVSS